MELVSILYLAKKKMNKPSTNIFNPFSQRSPSLRDHFISVQPYLGHIVKQRKQWCQRKSGNEQCHKTVLQNWKRINSSKACSTYWILSKKFDSLTHFQVFVEQRQPSGILEVIVALPRLMLVFLVNGTCHVAALSPPIPHFTERFLKIF